MLEGITRDTIITLARERGLPVAEKRDEIYCADEAFFTGIAALYGRWALAELAHYILTPDSRGIARWQTLAGRRAGRRRWRRGRQA